ncbi:phosphopyruvate hydratase [Psychromonas sp. 14N.309.X.WAT.B.A12]|uniref:phosphopyruvate hydratase n=1 Tax=unclassified Psychromonas TaxID=2614957 RepID=UPI0025AEEFD2|nr:phosphopyruvate hydratase [Psychromonas sp. 14N.309.X.WAT.B.A12]MDN2663846.1 phosphopyruvate hydratase [Psychromonas sp. 14N.309.X.WAT.B.A12]
MPLIIEILGWTSVFFYIFLMVFNGMKNIRLASFLSVINDVSWGILIGVMPKVLLNLVVGSVTLYRYLCDFTELSTRITKLILVIMIAFLTYATYFSVNDYLANPSLGLLLTWVDFAVILTALSVKKIRLFQGFMWLSAFVGGYAYYLLGIDQMVVIKMIVGLIMTHKLFIHPLFPQVESKLLFWKR